MRPQFKELWENISGYSKTEVMEKKLEALYLELRYIGSVVETLANNQIVKKHRQTSQEPAGTTGKKKDEQLSV